MSTQASILHTTALALATALVASCGGPQAFSGPRLPVERQSERVPAPRPSADEREMQTPRPVRLVELRNESSPLVTFRIVFESGSADDPSGREGLTYLAARTMAEGGTESMTYEEITRRLFPMAARVSFQVDRDMTVFIGQVHRDHVANFYPILRDLLLRPRFSEEDFRRVRTQTIAALTQELRGGNDEELGKEVLQSLIYAQHPYGHPEIGTETGLSAATVADARAQRERVFCRDRVIVGLAGGYPAELSSLVRQDMEALPAHCAPRNALPRVARPSGMHVVIVDKPDAGSTAISIGLPIEITRASADFPALQFATNYLGLHRQSSGVLYNTIRERRGLNYGDYAYAEHFEQEGWSRFPTTNIQRREQYASIWIRPVRPNSAHFALRAAVRALARLLEQGIPADDFERTRTFLNGYVSLYAQTESQRLGYRIDDVWTGAAHGDYAERMRNAWATLDREAVRATAARHLSARDLWVAIVAPNARELADAIARNAPSPITYDSPKPAEVLAEDQEIQAFSLAVRPENVRVIPLAEVFR